MPPPSADTIRDRIASTGSAIGELRDVPLPFLRAVDLQFDALVELRDLGVPWRPIADAINGATRGALRLVSDRQLADAFSKVATRRRAAARRGQGAAPLGNPASPSATKRGRCPPLEPPQDNRVENGIGAGSVPIAPAFAEQARAEPLVMNAARKPSFVETLTGRPPKE